ncbi:MAG: hypothetical protein K2G51_13760 [Lachnospiraceae bacterium]|nr:hypothetical protein [Lachnospiraceae bacterium]
MKIEKNIQWHPAFCSAIELELWENKKDLKYEREHNLSRLPLKIDFLVIKKKPNVVIKNEIGDFFLKNNIFEYKSPGDSMDAGTFYKALSYACLYKDETENADEILDMDTTITLVREQRPEKLFRQLAEKYELAKRSEGIYRIRGMLFPVQFLVTSEMNEEGHVFLTSLTRTMSREQAQRLLDKASKLKDNEDRKNADSVVNVASEANINLFKKMIQEGDQMCEELKEMLAPEIIEFKMLLAEQKAKLADRDAKLADKDAKLADKDARLADKDAKLADNATKLADQDAEIKKLKKMLAEAGIKM